MGFPTAALSSRHLQIYSHLRLYNMHTHCVFQGESSPNQSCSSSHEPILLVYIYKSVSTRVLEYCLSGEISTDCVSTKDGRRWKHMKLNEVCLLLQPTLTRSYYSTKLTLLQLVSNETHFWCSLQWNAERFHFRSVRLYSNRLPVQFFIQHCKMSAVIQSQFVPLFSFAPTKTHYCAALKKE